MASRYEVEVTIESARDLKNVNWRNGNLRAYAVAWVDPAAKFSTKADVDGDTNPVWDEKLTIPLPRDLPLDDAVLHIDVVHAGAGDDGIKPLVGSARLPLREILGEAGVGGKVTRSLKLKRPSGRPHGRIEVKVRVSDREAPRYYEPYATPYGQPAASRDFPGSGGAYGQPAASRDFPGSGGAYGQPLPSAPAAGYPYAAPPATAGYGYGAPPAKAAGYGYGAPPPQAAEYGYGQQQQGAGYGYGQQQQGVGYGYGQQQQQQQKSKFGMGTGLAVGAAGGLLGGLVLAEGAEYVEDKIADDAAEKVEDNLGYDDGGYGDDF